MLYSNNMDLKIENNMSVTRTWYDTRDSKIKKSVILIWGKQSLKENVLEHEIGHALGWSHFNHIDGHIMSQNYQKMGNITTGLHVREYEKQIDKIKQRSGRFQPSVYKMKKKIFEKLTIKNIRDIIIEEITLNTRFKNSWKGFSGKNIKPYFKAHIEKEEDLNKKNNRDPGAGFLVYRHTDSGILVLGLIMTQDKREKKGAMFDIPKGGMDKGEDYIACAIRECEEETGIKINTKQIMLPGFEKDDIKIFPVESYENPIIQPNPHSGIIEHEGYRWLTPESLINNCIPWLKIYILECLNQIVKK